MSNVPSPGLRGQERYRNGFRVAALVFLGITLWAGYVGLHALFTDPFAEGAKPWMMFIAIFGFFLTGVCAQAGFIGVASRYVAGEGAPVLKDSVAYLTDGEGLLGVGRTVDDAPSKFCQTCGKPAGGAARFCESCGHAFA
jgi:hypothetical protein